MELEPKIGVEGPKISDWEPNIIGAEVPSDSETYGGLEPRGELDARAPGGIGAVLGKVGSKILPKVAAAVGIAAMKGLNIVGGFNTRNADDWGGDGAGGKGSCEGE